MIKLLLARHYKVLALILFVGLSLNLPLSGAAQAQRISLNMRQATMKEIFNQIQRSSDYDFVYSDADVSGLPRRDASFRNTPVSDILGEVLAGTRLQWEVDGNTIVIKRSTRQAPQSTPRVSGRVTDAAGNPLAGVAVVIKGSTVGVSTDGSGAFAIDVPPGETVLTFRYLGKKPQEITVSQGTGNINVTMQDDVTDIESVVVTGIFNRSRESYTGSVTQISDQEIQMYRGQNLISTIANIDPSVNLVVNNTYGSDPNMLPEINIRGNSSLPVNLEQLNSGVSAKLNTPLIIMDGFEITLQKLMDFNDQEIESITILKDASATAIYGSRGSNGVIVVTTKRPAQGNLRITAQVGLNIEAPDLSSYNLTNAREKLLVEQMSGVYTSDRGPMDQIALDKKYNEILSEVEKGVDTDWISQPVHTGIGQRYNLRLDYGTEQFQVGVNLGYNTTAGVMKGSQRNTFSGSVTLSYRHRNLLFRNQTSVDMNKAKNSPYGSFSSYANMNPYWRIYDEQGQMIKTYTSPVSGSEFENPLYNSTLNIVDQSKYTTLMNNFSIEWTIIDGLTLRGNLGLSRTTDTSDKFLPPGHTSFQTSTYQSSDMFFLKGSYDYSSGERTAINGNVTLNYVKLLGEKHQIYAGLDYSMSDDNSTNYSFAAQGFVNDRLDFFGNGLQFREGSKPSGTESLTRSIGFTGNVNYTFDNRYYLDLSYRIDGSSLFGAKNRFAPFWSVGIGWNLHQEAFLRDWDPLTRLRLKGSIGETGSQQFASYQALSTFQYQSGSRYLVWNGAELMGLGNERLKWQTTVQSNIGLEADFLDGRISGSIDVYKKKTKGLLSQMDLSPSNGFTSYTENVGTVENKGFEASLSGFLVRNTERGLYWSVTGRIAYNKNKIIKLSDEIKAQTEKYKDSRNANYSLLYEGHSVNSIYAVPSLGIDPSTGHEIFLDKDGRLTPDWDASARRLYGVADPAYRGNISTLFVWKNLSVNLSFAYQWGGQQYNSTLLNKVEVNIPRLANNVDRRVFTDRWYRPGDVKFFKSADELQVTNMSSRFVMDDNVFQLQSASVSYRWNSPWIRRNIGVDTMNFTVNMSDIFYVSTIERERGTAYPFSRKISMSISLLF